VAEDFCQTRPSPPTTARGMRLTTAAPGLHHLSCRVDSIDEVRAFEERLRALNVRLLYQGSVPHAEGAQSGGVCFEDPDSIRLEVFSPTGARHQAAPTPGAPSCGFY